MCAAKIIRPNDFLTMPWKNGGGITHEIVKKVKEGRFLWRLSIAEVASDGPFSSFPELERILTVIEGKGLSLHTGDTILEAKPFCPVAFSGDVRVVCKRHGDLVKDFNVIFDPQRARSTVTMADGINPLCVQSADGVVEAVLFLTEGRCDGMALPTHALVVVDDDRDAVTCEGRAIHIRFSPQVLA